MEGSSVTRGELRFCDATSINGSPDGNRMLYPRALLREMFESQTGDWEMIGSDGKAFKFHKDVMFKQVARFRTIFAHPGTRECIKKQIVVPPGMDMTGPAVEAFLRFIYYQDVEPMNSSLEITFALIRAGHYYDIPRMVQAADDVLYLEGVIFKKSNWLKLQACCLLYEEVCLWEASHPSKERIMNDLAAIIKEFWKKDPGSFADVCEPLMSLVTKFEEDKQSPTTCPIGKPHGWMDCPAWNFSEHVGIQKVIRENHRGQASQRHNGRDFMDANEDDSEEESEEQDVGQRSDEEDEVD